MWVWLSPYRAVAEHPCDVQQHVDMTLGTTLCRHIDSLRRRADRRWVTQVNGDKVDPVGTVLGGQRLELGGLCRVAAKAHHSAVNVRGLESSERQSDPSDDPDTTNRAAGSTFRRAACTDSCPSARSSYSGSGAGRGGVEAVLHAVDVESSPGESSLPMLPRCNRDRPTRTARAAAIAPARHHGEQAWSAILVWIRVAVSLLA